MSGLIFAGVRNNGDFVQSWAGNERRAFEGAGRLGLVHWGSSPVPGAIPPPVRLAMPVAGPEKKRGALPLPPIELPVRIKAAGADRF